MHTYVLDGDNIRHGLNSNLGFSPEDRVENIRRVSEVAKLMADSGVVDHGLYFALSNGPATRPRDRTGGQGRVYGSVCGCAVGGLRGARPEDLYKKARAGEIRQFTGIDAPYEAPEDAEIVVRTDRQTGTNQWQRFWKSCCHD